MSRPVYHLMVETGDVPTHEFFSSAVKALIEVSPYVDEHMIKPELVLGDSWYMSFDRDTALTKLRQEGHLLICDQQNADHWVHVTRRAVK